MMKILLVSNMYPDEKHLSYGIFVKKFCLQLEKLGISYQLSVMHKADNKLIKIFNYIKFYFETIYKILFTEYDLIYVHYASHSGIPVLLTRKFWKRKVYVNVHGSDVVPENKIQDKFQKCTYLLLEECDKIIVPSNYFRNYVYDKYKISNDKIYVYPSGGVDADLFYQYSDIQINEFCSSFNIDKNHPVFGMAGRISYGKGWDVFVKAINNAKKAGVYATFVIVGSGTDDFKLRELLKEYNLENTVLLIDMLPQDELAKFYASLDFFVFPTFREGESLGLVALEALACGTPVICSDIAAPADYIEEGVNGFKFQCKDDVELCSVIKNCVEYYNRNEKYIELKRGAIKTAEKYKADNLLDDLYKIVKE